MNCTRIVEIARDFNASVVGMNLADISALNQPQGVTMDLSTLSDQALKELIAGTTQAEPEFLAAKILLSTLRSRFRLNSSPVAVAQYVEEMKGLLSRFEKMHAAQNDGNRTSTAQRHSGQDEVLFSLAEVASKVAQGKNLVLAGDRALLKEVPAGKWIGGTIPYFMARQGGVFTKEKLFVTELPGDAKSVSIKTYTAETISSVYNDAPENGLSIVIMPGSSPIHSLFALKAPSFQRFATRPLIGWIAGTDVADIGKVIPEVISGTSRLSQRNAAVVMHVGLPANTHASINIVNIFKQGAGDCIMFSEDGFSATDAQVNGVKKSFAEYLLEKKIDTRLPLVADYSGAMINTSFQGVDARANKVSFYAPVFRGVEYRIAAPMPDYVSAFESRLPKFAADTIAFSCNCILNYLYANLEGKRTGTVTGPITFGEIAYQLLNQTLAYVTIQKSAS
jgi:hypothetical protein